MNCSDWDVGCLVGVCHEGSGECHTEANDALCDGGECTFWPADTCGGDQPPCKAQELPGGSNDEAINACVCAVEDNHGRCQGDWEASCITYAEESCGLICQ